MRVITKIKRKLSFETRTIKFINDYKAYMDAFSNKMKNQTIQKAEFLRAIIRIKLSLIALKNHNLSYKKTKNKDYKKLIRESVKDIKRNKKLIMAIIEKNHNFYMNIHAVRYLRSR